MTDDGTDSRSEGETLRGESDDWSVESVDLPFGRDDQDHSNAGRLLVLLTVVLIALLGTGTAQVVSQSGVLEDAIYSIERISGSDGPGGSIGGADPASTTTTPEATTPGVGSPSSTPTSAGDSGERDEPPTEESDGSGRRTTPGTPTRSPTPTRETQTSGPTPAPTTATASRSPGSTSGTGASGGTGETSGGSGSEAPLQLRLASTSSTAQTILDVTDVYPGQSGTARITVHNDGTRAGRLWLTRLSVTQSENGLAEPERSVDDSPSAGELASHVAIRMYLDTGTERVYLLGSESTYTDLDATAGTTDRRGGVVTASGEDALVVEWHVVESAGNDVMTDAVEFSVTLELRSVP